MTTQEIDRGSAAGGMGGGSGGATRTLRSFLESDGAQAKLAEVATKYMTAGDLVRLTLVAASRQPDLMKCSQTSILRALMDAATLGIMPGGTMGRGYLVPRKNKVNGTLEACFDPGYRGLIDVARRSGKVKKFDAKVVYAGDLFEYEEGTNQTLRHVPNLEAGKRGDVVAAYAIAKLEDGEPQIEVLTRADIDKIRNSSAAKGGGPWLTWFEEMARKSAARRLCKWLPYDPMLEKAMEASDAADMPGAASITSVAQIGSGSARLSALDEQLRARQQAAGDALDLGAPVGNDDPVPPPIDDDDGGGSDGVAATTTNGPSAQGQADPQATAAPRQRKPREPAAPAAASPPKGGAVQQTTIPGANPTPPVAPRTAADVQANPPSSVPAVAPATVPAASTAPTLEQERARLLNEQNDLIEKLGLKPGDPVTVTLPNGARLHTETKGYARLYGDHAVINVTHPDVPEGRVALSTVQKGHV